MAKPTQPGEYFSFDAIGGEPQLVPIRDVGECGLAVCFPERDDYGLLDDVSGSFQPAPHK